jgi:hypothetical protein
MLKFQHSHILRRTPGREEETFTPGFFMKWGLIAAGSLFGVVVLTLLVVLLIHLGTPRPGWANLPRPVTATEYRRAMKQKEVNVDEKVEVAGIVKSTEVEEEQDTETLRVHLYVDGGYELICHFPKPPRELPQYRDRIIVVGRAYSAFYIQECRLVLRSPSPATR